MLAQYNIWTQVKLPLGPPRCSEKDKDTYSKLIYFRISWGA